MICNSFDKKIIKYGMIPACGTKPKK